MKKEFYIFALSIALGLGSCNSWLDVKPETEVEIDAMYSQQQGFQDALIGAYLNLKSSNAYGQELMYGAVEYLAQHWNYNSGTVQEKISRYNYIDESVQGRFESIYSQLYKIIASVNVILANIDAKQDVFETDIYEIIKGEGLAMRAYCHFDLLRLFGPMPTNVGSSTILPYVTTVTTEYHQHHTYEQYVSYLEEDLITADTLLKKSDPVQTSIATEENSWSVSATDFLRARQLRFNYYAVKALEARFYLWLGGTDNKTKAYQAAKEVIDATNEDGSKKYKLGTVNDITNKDYSFSVEHIMAVYDYDLYDRASGNFTESAPFAKEEALRFNTRSLFRKQSPYAYHLLWNNGLLDGACSHMKICREDWTIDKIRERALKYSNIKDFKKYDMKAYMAASRYKCLKDVTSHMKRLIPPKGFYTLEKCKEEALKYQTRKDFMLGSPKFYDAAHRFKWIDLCCEHMKRNYRTTSSKKGNV